MFYLNNEDIEEMFREAAERYKVTTDAAFDWERIEQTLRNERDKAAGIAQQKKRRKLRYALFSLLLLPLGWFASYTWNDYFENKVAYTETAKQSNIHKDEMEIKSSLNINPAAKQPTQSLIAGNFNIQQKNNSLFNIMSGANTIIADTQNEYVITSNKYNLLNNIESNKRQLNFLKPALTNENAIVSNTTQQKMNKDFSLEKKITIIKKRQSGFYAGLVFSPDITFIKFQHTQGIGSSFGLIAGYRFNNKWSIETGLLADSKKYFTEGDYFDKANVDYLQDKELINLKGKCSMIEIPFNTRYTFAEQKKGKWTATLGMSAYFVNKEFYHYTVIENGQEERSDHTYYHSGNKITPVLNFAVGYEHNLANNLDLRIEPYYKLPLNGMGTGKLYLSSTGINIGITKLFR